MHQIEWEFKHQIELRMVVERKHGYIEGLRDTAPKTRKTIVCDRCDSMCKCACIKLCLCKKLWIFANICMKICIST